MADLPPGLEQFAVRLREAAEADAHHHRPARHRRPVLRRLALPVAATLLTGAVGAGAVGLIDPGQGPPVTIDGRDAGGQRAPKDPGVVAASATADPGGGLPWVVRVYTDASGQECAQAGRLRGGLFGQLEAGRFRELPGKAPGICGPEDRPRTLAAVDRRGDPPLTLVFGLSVSRKPVTISLGTKTTTVRPVGLGAYIAVFAGVDRAQVTVIDGDGTPQHPQ